MNRSRVMVVAALVACIVACRPGTPSEYIQPDDMEDILVDYFTARALAQQDQYTHDEREYNLALYTQAVLAKHGVTQEDFDSSLVYYFTRADRFDPIFQRVADRLEDHALDLGASEGEIGKYVQYNADGDTANIWPDRNMALLMPQPPFNRWEFEVQADTTFRRGDALMLLFMSDYMYQQGAKSGLAYIAAEYADTTVSRTLRFSVSGVSQLRVPEDTARTMQRVKGFFYLDGANDPTPSTRLLFLKNVQLIRFHTTKEEDKRINTNDSIRV